MATLLPGQTTNALIDARLWRPSSRLGRLLVMPVRLIPGPLLVRTYQVTAGIALVFSNLVGVAIVMALTVVVIPGASFRSIHNGVLFNVTAIGVYLVFAFGLGAIVILRRSNAAWKWIDEQRLPTPEEERAVLQAPLRVLRALVFLWVGAAIVFTSLNLALSPRIGLRVALTTLIGGLSTAAFGYLLTERVMRPAARVVLSNSSHLDRPALPGAPTRQMLTWLLATGAPVFGVWLVGVLVLTDHTPTSAHKVAIAMVVLGSIALTAGAFAEYVAVRAIADPVRKLGAAIEKVSAGDLTTRVTIDDATEIGLMQDGFNRMAASLEERDELEDLFGRHVGADVAATSLERGVVLGGETHRVAAMFADVVGSTTIAMERPAGEVVELMNCFFAVVVDVTTKHGGVVNKFAGDGALVVFGAPIPLEDAADRALRSARELAARLERDAPETPAAIGLSGGEVIAGNVGTPDRFEYTVMGDPVNEAARLTSQAKGLPLRVAAAGRLLAEASVEERAFWEVQYSVVLRGRTERTDVAGLALPARTDL